MTISYSGQFSRLLIRWKGSVWKTTWKELIAFLSAYYLIRILYRLSLHPNMFSANSTMNASSVEEGVIIRQHHHIVAFEKVIYEFDEFTKRIPLTFLLGFYVNAVVRRWWEQFELISWPDDVLNSLNLIIPPSADHEEINTKRRSIARYVNLTLVLAWREISIKVRKRFPSLEHLIKANLMTVEESELYENSDLSLRWYQPLIWSQDLVKEYCRTTQVPAPLLTMFYGHLYRLRRNCHQLHCYDWVCLPLVYTQVTALCTYGYFALCLIGRQFFDPDSTFAEKRVDYYVPIFSILEFLFYVGWFKVGQDLMRPFEEDDDDFELNYIIDRNVRASLALINGQHETKPSLVNLAYWNQRTECGLPHTKVSAKLYNHPPIQHAYVSLKDPNKYLFDDNTPIRLSETSESFFRKWRYF